MTAKVFKDQVCRSLAGFDVRCCLWLDHPAAARLPPAAQRKHDEEQEKTSNVYLGACKPFELLVGGGMGRAFEEALLL